MQGWDLLHFSLRRRHSRQLVIMRLRLLMRGFVDAVPEAETWGEVEEGGISSGDLF